MDEVLHVVIEISDATLQHIEESFQRIKLLVHQL